MKIFTINPVRNVTDTVRKELYEYVENLEAQGHTVHFNMRDVDQTDDGTGLFICESHRAALLKSDEVHVYWDPASVGSYFDLGMTFATLAFEPEIKVKIINAPGLTDHKSFGNILHAIASGMGRIGEEVAAPA